MELWLEVQTGSSLVGVVVVGGCRRSEATAAGVNDCFSCGVLQIEPQRYFSSGLIPSVWCLRVLGAESGFVIFSDDIECRQLGIYFITQEKANSALMNCGDLHYDREEPKERKGGKKGPRPINPNLPRVEEQIADPDPKELICPVFFEFAEVKHGTTPANTLKNYKGRLQTDGASNFGGVPSRPDIQHLNSWAHVRRYFVKAEENAAPGASSYLDAIDRLFRRERIIRRFRREPESVLELRRRYSLSEVDELFKKPLAYALTQGTQTAQKKPPSPHLKALVAFSGW